MNRLFLSATILFFSVFSSLGQGAPVSEEEFAAIIQKTNAFYQSIAAGHQQSLSIEADWDNPEANAQSQQGEGGGSWKTFINGGLARHPKMTADGFTLVVCHELGHHLAGYPMYVGDWGMINSLASEGQADYYATQACLRDLWKGEDNTVDLSSLPATVIEKCDAAWQSLEERELCYRIVLAGKSAADTWADNEETTASLEARDPGVVEHTNHNYYPKAQCRLDTYVAGALCDVPFDHSVIPGRLNANGQQSQDAFDQAMRQSCLKGVGARPACWFYPAPPFHSSILFRR